MTTKPLTHTEAIEKLNELLPALIEAKQARVLVTGWGQGGVMVTIISFYGVLPSTDRKYLIEVGEEIK